MGRSFKAPPRDDHDAWEAVRLLYAAGFRFFSYRSSEAAPLPVRARDVPAFVRAHPDHPFRVAAKEPVAPRRS